MKNVYQNLILELNQLKQGVLESMRKYKEKMTLQNKFQGCFRAQGHDGTNPIFGGINALVLKHFTIGFLSELQQQVRNEEVKMLNEVTEVVKKKHGENFMTNCTI
jgi:hypothetical protein